MVARLTSGKIISRQANDPARVAYLKKLAALDKQVAAAKSVPTHDQFQRVGHSLFAVSGGFVWRNARRLVLRTAQPPRRSSDGAPNPHKVELSPHQNTKLAGFFQTRPSTLDVQPARPPGTARVGRINSGATARWRQLIQGRGRRRVVLDVGGEHEKQRPSAGRVRRLPARANPQSLAGLGVVFLVNRQVSRSPRDRGRKMPRVARPSSVARSAAAFGARRAAASARAVDS